MKAKVLFEELVYKGKTHNIERKDITNLIFLFLENLNFHTEKNQMYIAFHVQLQVMFLVCFVCFLFSYLSHMVM